MVPMQTQSNGYNCGMFAIAFVTDVFNGLSPVNSCFDITLIHSHLIQFLETEVTVFPKAPKCIRATNTAFKVNFIKNYVTI